LAYFDEEVCNHVSTLCSEIQSFCRSLPEHSQISIEAENLIQMGSIIDHDNNRILLTPLSPINLAFEAALTKRVGGEAASSEVLKLLSQSALLPFLQWPTWGGEKIFAARTFSDAPQWLEYRPKTDEGHTFGSRVSQTVASKLDQFTRHFKFLFDADNGAPLVIYLINLGDCIEVVKGIAQFYDSQIQFQQNTRGRENDFWIDGLVPIHVHIFGKTESVTQFDRLTNAAWNDDLFELIGGVAGSDFNREQIIEALLRKVHFFYRRDKEFDEISQTGARAHIAFMQTGGGVSEYFAGARFSYNQKAASYSGVSLGGLNADLPSYMYGNLYRSGFGTKGLTDEYRNELVDLADALNTVVRFVGRTDPYSSEECLFQVFDKGTHGLLSNAFEASQWVCFVSPQFDLDFFQGRNDVIVLHYSDQFNNASGYDAITVTSKISQYREMLRDAILSETGVKHLFEDPSALDGLVQLFNAVNGEWLLEMVNTSLNNRKEKVGVISALKALLSVLRSDTGILWVPISIEEIVRVSGAVGLSQKDGAFSARNMGFSGSFSDDILMIGVRAAKGDAGTQMMFFPVEVKYGTFTNTVKEKAFQQCAKVARYFKNSSEDDSFRGEAFRNFFAKMFLSAAEKLHTFGFWSDSKWKVVCEELRVPLLNDGFEVVDAFEAGYGNFGIIAFDRGCIARSAKLQEQLFEASKVQYASLQFTLQDCFIFCAKSLDEIHESLANDPRVTLCMTRAVSVDGVEDMEREDDESATPISTCDTHETSAKEDSSTSTGSEDNEVVRKKIPSFSTLSEEDRRDIYVRIYDKLKALRVDLDPKPPDEIEFREGPTVYMVEVPLAASAKIRDLERAQEDLNLVLQLPGEDSVRVVPDRGIAWLEVPKSEDKRVMVTTEHIWADFSPDMEQFAVPFAVDIAGATVCIDFASANSPHLLIAGTTGSGKSVALETIIQGAARMYDAHQLKMFLIDPKGNELVDFEDLSQVVSPNGRSAEDAIEKLRACVDEMDSRYDLFREAKKTHGKSAKKLTEYNRMVQTPIPRWLVILDEYSDLIESSKDNKLEIESLLKRLSQKARAAGIHLILATQKPLAEVVNSVVKSNLPAAIALKVKSNSDSRVIIDEGGAELLSGRGDALFRTGSGKLTRIQIAIFASS
jgi:DNA phosphorothioation-dependent restriction protein DptH